MHDRLAELESRLAVVEQRLNTLEKASSVESALIAPPPEPTLDEGFVANASTHLGRVLLIFGGAYLLRAITDFEFVPTGIGILMGTGYALFWLSMAYRKAGIQDQRATAAFYGGTSIVLGLPLFIEATTRFELLSGPQGAAALAVFCALALTVAATRNLRSIGWLIVGGGIAAALTVMIVSHSAVAIAIFLLTLGLGSLWAVYWRRWMGMQWLGAFGANAGVVALVVFGGSDQWTLEPRTAAFFGTALALSYLVSFAVRSHKVGHDVGIFEAVQAPVVGVIAFWAAGVAAKSGQFSVVAIGVLGLALGAAAYALAFSAQTRAARGRNFYFYSTLGLLLVISGSGLILAPTAAALLWSLMALTMAWMSGRTGRVALSLQCTFLLLAAGVASGILATGLHALTGDAAADWPSLSLLHAGIALTTVACLFLPVAQHSERWGTLAGVPQLIVLALSVWQVGGLIVVVMAPIFAAASMSEPDLAVLAALRTAVLAAASVTLALSSRHPRWPEARWLVYPVLALVGIKLFLEDFPHGQPATLFVALVFVGSALLLVAKLLNRGPSTKPA